MPFGFERFSSMKNNIFDVKDRNTMHGISAIKLVGLVLLLVAPLKVGASDPGVVERKEIEQYFSDKVLETLEVEAEVVQCRVKPRRFADVVLVRKDFDKEGSTYHPRRWDFNAHLDENSNPTRYSFTVWGFAGAYALSTENISYLFVGEDIYARFNREIELQTIDDIASTGNFSFYKDSYPSSRAINVTITNPEKIKQCLIDEDFKVSKNAKFGFIWD